MRRCCEMLRADTSSNMELVLPLLCLCVLSCSGSTSAAGAEPERIIVKEGRDVILPCSITGDISYTRFEWKKEGQKEVYVYDGGIVLAKDEQFKGRVSHVPGELKTGNASITIRNTKMADAGNYTCEFPRLNQKVLISLLVEPERIIVMEGSDVILPCSTTGDIKHFEWKKDGQEVYISGKWSGQDEQFKGRVSHVPGELKTGNASIIIRKAKVADTGTYTCESGPNHKQAIYLRVDATPKPYVTILNHTKDWALLQCEVHGASPKPVVQWQDRAGTIIPAEEPQVSERGGSYDIILQTTVTKTDYYRCVATQIFSEIFVYVIGPETPPETRVPWWIWMIIAIAVFMSFVLAFRLLCRRG